jgi:hypothetical protein
MELRSEVKRRRVVQILRRGISGPCFGQNIERDGTWLMLGFPRKGNPLLRALRTCRGLPTKGSGGENCCALDEPGWRDKSDKTYRYVLETGERFIVGPSDLTLPAGNQWCEFHVPIDTGWGSTDKSSRRKKTLNGNIARFPHKIPGWICAQIVGEWDIACSR